MFTKFFPICALVTENLALAPTPEVGTDIFPGPGRYREISSLT